MQSYTNLITRSDLSNLLSRPDAGGIHLFEVLPIKYWLDGHLPGAKAMPPDKLVEIAAAEVPDKAAAIVLYCASATCENSHAAARKLTSLGYSSVSVYAGGKADWADAGLALERGNRDAA